MLRLNRLAASRRAVEERRNESSLLIGFIVGENELGKLFGVPGNTPSYQH
jgi:hypothetical protein